MENQELGICYECSTKDGDSSKKTVYRCDICGKWFCELHQKPKFPYFVDWETQFDVQGNPAIKAMFYSEYGRRDGHADFVYLTNTIQKLQADEKSLNESVKKALDRMSEASPLTSEISEEEKQLRMNDAIILREIHRKRLLEEGKTKKHWWQR